MRGPLYSVSVDGKTVALYLDVNAVVYDSLTRVTSLSIVAVAIVVSPSPCPQ